MTFKAGELDGGAYIRGGGNSDEKSISQYEINAMILRFLEVTNKCLHFEQPHRHLEIFSFVYSITA